MILMSKHPQGMVNRKKQARENEHQITSIIFLIKVIKDSRDIVNTTN